MKNNNLEKEKNYKSNFFKNINDLKNETNIIGWFVLFILIILIFENIIFTKDVNVTNDIKIKKEKYSKEDAKEPETYCSKDGIEYWINGYTETNSKPRYILSVVYDSSQKPKKCNN